MKEKKEHLKWIHADIEKQQNIDMSGMQIKIKEMIAGCIKSQKEWQQKLLQKWNEYIGDNFYEDSEENLQFKKMEGPVILKSEIRSRLDTITRSKAEEPDNILIEILEAK